MWQNLMKKENSESDQTVDEVLAVTILSSKAAYSQVIVGGQVGNGHCLDATLPHRFEKVSLSLF